MDFFGDKVPVLIEAIKELHKEIIDMKEMIKK